MNPWFEPLKDIIPYIFRISTPNGSGTGFQILYSKNMKFCGIATALHVIRHAHEWEEIIKVTHHKSNKTVILKRKEDRFIFPYPERDLAFILFPKGDLPVEENDLQLINPKTSLRQGVETAWCGFPSVAPPTELCFFAGHISCYLADKESYLVDGVAINGVSGGPAFYIPEKKDISGNSVIYGLISAYLPNREMGEALPGLCIVRSVEPYQETLKKIRTLDEAERKAREQEEEAKKSVSTEGQSLPEA